MHDTVSRSDVEKVRSIAVLVRYGVPFDIAAKMSAGEKAAYLIAFGELEGLRWDWDRLCWSHN